jgi:hypothetical protein
LVAHDGQVKAVLVSVTIAMLTGGADAHREQFISDSQSLQLNCPPLNDRSRIVDLVHQSPAKWLRASIRFSLNTRWSLSFSCIVFSSVISSLE